jgi:DNA-binding SARP family transcriptional activator
MLEFRILGPTEVWNEDEQLQLGGPKQRAVLALLLLEAGRVVSTDRLIDLLWGGRRRHCGVASIRLGSARDERRVTTV